MSTESDDVMNPVRSTISLPKSVSKKAHALAGNNFSGWIRDLVEKAANGAIPTAVDDSDALISLAKVYHPTLAAEFEERLMGRLPLGKEGPTQARIIARLLEALVVALKDPRFDPTQPFAVYNSAEQLRAAMGPQGFAVAAAMFAALEGDEKLRSELFGDLNEPKTGYGPKSFEEAKTKARRLADQARAKTSAPKP